MFDVFCIEIKQSNVKHGSNVKRARLTFYVFRMMRAAPLARAGMVLNSRSATAKTSMTIVLASIPVAAVVGGSRPRYQRCPACRPSYSFCIRFAASVLQPFWFEQGPPTRNGPAAECARRSHGAQNVQGSAQRGGADARVQPAEATKVKPG